MSVAVETPRAAERRRAPRRQPAVGTVCRLGGDSAKVALVWNISLSGVSLLFPEPLAKGDSVKGELQAGGADIVKVGLRVAHVSPLMTGDYVLGCQFDRPLTTEQMAAFTG